MTSVMLEKELHVQIDARNGSDEDVAALAEKRKALQVEVAKLQVCA